jgi:hypothetical protein
MLSAGDMYLERKQHPKLPNLIHFKELRTKGYNAT